jgi:hypothetical protein
MLAAQSLSPFVLDEMPAVGVGTRDEFHLYGMIRAAIAITGTRGFVATRGWRARGGLAG